MTIVLNGKPHDTDAGTLAGLLAELGLPTPSIATAINGEFVSRERRSETPLSVGDRIEIVSPREGG